MFRKLAEKMLIRLSDKNDLLARLCPTKVLENDLLYCLLQSSYICNLRVDIDLLKRKTLTFVNQHKVAKHVFLYKYADSTTESNLYSSIFACLIRSLYYL